MVSGGRASGGQNRVKELERIWNVPLGNKDLHFSGFCLPIKGEEMLNSQLVF